MKYTLLIIFSGMSIFLAVNILMLKITALSEYGWGYFTGKLILLGIFVTLSIFTLRSIQKKRH